MPEGESRLRLTYVGHATVLIEADGLRCLTDPFLRDRLGPLRRHGPTPDPAAIGALDLVLISHAHPDHFDPRSLRRLQGDPLTESAWGAAAIYLIVIVATLGRPLLIASDLVEREHGYQVLTNGEYRRSRIGQALLLIGICVLAAVVTF